MNSSTTDDPQKGEEANIERVLQAVGPRVQPSDEMAGVVRAAAHAEWASVVSAQRRKRRMFVAFAAAASLAFVALAVWLGYSALGTPPAPVASIARVSGDVRISRSWWQRARPANALQSLQTGETLVTGASGRTALALASGVSLRLDHGSSIELHDAHRIRMISGAVYVDSPGGRPQERRLLIDTPMGTVEHVGTQYEVRYTDSGVRVRVREGRVGLAPNQGASLSGAAGEQLTLSTNGHVDRTVIATHGADWDWVSEAAPSFDIDGRSLRDFLSWAGRELGQAVVFATPESEAEARRVVLNGSVAGLGAKDALAVVLSTTRLRSSDSDGKIVVAMER